jgi:hypothetical protein
MTYFEVERGHGVSTPSDTTFDSELLATMRDPYLLPEGFWDFYLSFFHDSADVVILISLSASIIFALKSSSMSVPLYKGILNKQELADFGVSNTTAAQRLMRDLITRREIPADSTVDSLKAYFRENIQSLMSSVEMDTGDVPTVLQPVSATVPKAIPKPKRIARPAATERKRSPALITVTSPKDLGKKDMRGLQEWYKQQLKSIQTQHDNQMKKLNTFDRDIDRKVGTMNKATAALGTVATKDVTETDGQRFLKNPASAVISQLLNQKVKQRNKIIRDTQAALGNLEKRYHDLYEKQKAAISEEERNIQSGMDNMLAALEQAAAERPESYESPSASQAVKRTRAQGGKGCACRRKK